MNKKDRPSVLKYFKCLCLEISCFLCTRVCPVLNHSVVSDSATLWTVAHQAPLSMGFSMQEYWNGLPCLPPGDPPDPGIKPASLTSPALAGRLFTTNANWEVSFYIYLYTHTHTHTHIYLYI